jgi:hypothetical protein
LTSACESVLIAARFWATFLLTTTQNESEKCEQDYKIFVRHKLPSKRINARIQSVSLNYSELGGKNLIGFDSFQSNSPNSRERLTGIDR